MTSPTFHPKIVNSFQKWEEKGKTTQEHTLCASVGHLISLVLAKAFVTKVCINFQSWLELEGKMIVYPCGESKPVFFSLVTATWLKAS